MKILDPEKARHFLEQTHLINYMGFLNHEFFSMGLSFLFLFGMLTALVTILLLLIRTQRYYLPSFFLCFLISGFFTYASYRNIKISLPGEGMTGQAEKIIKGVKIVEKRVLRSLGKGETIRIDAEGYSDGDAIRAAAGKSFDSIFGLKGNGGFLSLQEGARQELLETISPLITVQGKEISGKMLVLHCSFDPEDIRSSVKKLGYVREPLHLKIEVGRNETSLDGKELTKRLEFLLSNSSRYYFGGGFHASPEALQKELEAMELRLEGDKVNRIKVSSIQRPSKESLLFILDVL